MKDEYDFSANDMNTTFATVFGIILAILCACATVSYCLWYRDRSKLSSQCPCDCKCRVEQNR